MAGRNAFREGVAQTVYETYQGVDPMTGRSMGDGMAGVFRGKRVERVAKAIADATPGKLDGLAPGEY